MEGTTGKKILAAVDLGSDTERVLAYAVWLAGNSASPAAGVDLLHVIDYALTPPAYMVPYIEQEKEQYTRDIEQWVDRIKALGVPSGYRIAVGRLVETFNSLLKQLGAGMLVTGYKSHLIRPSSSERLIRHLETPLCIVRGEKSERAQLGGVGIKKILCAVDFSENSRRALRFASQLAARSASELVVFHAVSTFEMERCLVKWDDAPDRSKESLKAECTRESEDNMRAFLQGVYSGEYVIRPGAPYKMINELAIERDVDLIVMGAKGMSFFPAMLFGSVSEAVMKSAPCPLVIIR